VAVAGALNTGSMVNGILFMILFGIGTIPIMFAIPMLGNIIGAKIRKKFSWVLSVFIILLGVLFILRGLDLGIMYVSPKSKMLKPHVMKKHENCCSGKTDTLELKQINTK